MVKLLKKLLKKLLISGKKINKEKQIAGLDYPVGFRLFSTPPPKICNKCLKDYVMGFDKTFRPIEICDCTSSEEIESLVN